MSGNLPYWCVYILTCECVSLYQTALYPLTEPTETSTKSCAGFKRSPKPCCDPLENIQEPLQNCCASNNGDRAWGLP